MNTELKEKMDTAAADYLDENGLLANYQEDNYAAGIRDGFWEGASAMYAELAPLVEWVSVKDRLPEEYKEVLIKCEMWGEIIIVSGHPRTGLAAPFVPLPHSAKIWRRLKSIRI